MALMLMFDREAGDGGRRARLHVGACRVRPKVVPQRICRDADPEMRPTEDQAEPGLAGGALIRARTRQRPCPDG